MRKFIQTCVTIDPELKAWAKAHGFVLSRVLDEALREKRKCQP